MLRVKIIYQLFMGENAMQLLYAIQQIRTPLLDAFFSVITRLGEETILLVIGMLIIWCLDKKWGFRFLFAGLAGTALNQLLKAIFLIPRPWVLDPEFEIVESAREAATGYSFPSGHTQSAGTVFGMIAMWLKRRKVTLACVVTILLVAFSRMYLGVHTPYDVGVSLLTSALTVFGMTALCERAKTGKQKTALILGMVGFALVLVLYVTFAPKRAANVAEFDAHGVENAWKLLGSMAGLAVAWYMDERYTHFETKAPFAVQALKLVVGFVLVMLVKEAGKPVLRALLDGHALAEAIRYFLMVIVGVGLWPMTFGRLARLGKK